ncbi:MAG: hypothetical protein V4655_07695 [Bdellovibrionota bacterium]|nr:MAG: hypothetical protein EOP10_16695 [Pseudomonadota bacterium]
MKRHLKILLPSLLLFGALNGCAYTSAVSLTNIPAQRDKPVEVSVKRWIFLGFNFDNDQVNEIIPKLKEKCPNGSVRGILTKDLTKAYFLAFIWARETIAKGYCVTSKSVAMDEDFPSDGTEYAAMIEGEDQ